MSRVVLVTGTNTGSGKTILTALLLTHLRAKGVRALAMKPVETGGRRDARLLHALQNDEATLDETNPFWFREALAPSIAARRAGQALLKTTVLKHMRAMRDRCDLLLVEGAGGLLSPIGKNWSALDLAKSLKAEVIVAARNELGVINHARLTLDRLRSENFFTKSLVLMGGGKTRVQRENNGEIGKYAGKTRVFEIPKMNLSGEWKRSISRCEKKITKTLALIMPPR